MFDSMSLASFLKAVLFVNAVLAIALASDLFGLVPPMPLVSQASVSVIIVSALVFFVGQTSVFPWLCGLPGVWRVFPNIDAEYTVDISSNWSIIKARNAGRQPDMSPEGAPVLFNRVGTAKISARLARIDMTLAMDDRYLSSETLTCSLQRHRGERKPVLFYVYDSYVSAPKTTDSQRHLGAARLSIPLQRCPKVLEGNYWTDRNWHQGLNTAGQIRLTRV